MPVALPVTALHVHLHALFMLHAISMKAYRHTCTHHATAMYHTGSMGLHVFFRQKPVNTGAFAGTNL